MLLDPGNIQFRGLSLYQSSVSQDNGQWLVLEAWKKLLGYPSQELLLPAKCIKILIGLTDS